MVDPGPSVQRLFTLKFLDGFLSQKVILEFQYKFKNHSIGNFQSKVVKYNEFRTHIRSCSIYTIFLDCAQPGVRGPRAQPMRGARGTWVTRAADARSQGYVGHARRRCAQQDLTD